MARVVELSFPASNTTAVAPLQTDITTPYVFSLNPYDGVNDGTRYPPGVATFNGRFARKISLTSAGNMSGVNFTIVGTSLAGTALTEVLAGPNANTVESVNIYASITSITPDGAYTAVSAGTGSVGVFAPIVLSAYTPSMNWALNINVTSTINYSVTGTLSRVFNPTGTTIALNAAADVFAINAALTAATTDQYYTSTQEVSALFITINSSTGGSLTGQFLQQGQG